MRLDDIEERAMAREARQWDDLARKMVTDTPVAPLLDEGRNGRERTRGKAIDRLDEAVTALAELDDDQYRQLAREVHEVFRSGEALRWRLAMSGMGVARQEARRVARSESAVEDAMQDAILGLFQAARRFDPDHGASFGTYARWWVRASLTRAINDGRMVRLSESALHRLRVMRDHLDEDPEASLDSVAEAAGMPTERASTLLALRQPDSMSDPVPGATGVTAGDLLPDDSHDDPDDILHRDQLWSLTLEAVEELDERSREVVVRRYGLQDGIVETLAAIADDFGVTPQRIRQIQKRAEGQMAELAGAHR